MARKKANYPLIEGLEITTLAAEGKAMGRYNDVVVFVPMTVPGDVVDVQIRSKRRRYMEGFVVNYVKRSPLREEPFCAHFGVCGGCKWQNLPYAEQLRFKTEQVRDQLARIGKVELPEIAPCLPSAETRFYRNKLEFTFAERRWLTYEEIAEKGSAVPPGRGLCAHQHQRGRISEHPVLASCTAGVTVLHGTRAWVRPRARRSSCGKTPPAPCTLA